MASIPFLRYGDLTIPGAKAINAAASPRGVSAAAERSVIPLVYGEDRIKALIVNVLPATTGSSTLLVQCLWCYGGESVNDVRLNERGLPVSATITNYTGVQTTPDAALVTAFAAQGITYTDTLAGLMYSVIAMPTATFDGQLDISARIRGRALYDPRQDSTAGGSGAQRLATPSTWAWSDNPALMQSDFLRNTVYGLGRTVDQSTVAACANACDALIGSPSEKRRICGVSFTQAASASDIAEALRAYAGCFLLPGPNGIKLVADVAGSSAATYLHSSGSIASISDLQRADLGNVPTAVEVIYTDTTQIPWRDSSAVASLSGAGTTRPWRLSQIRLPGIKRYTQAFREATERLAKLSSFDVSCTLEVFDVGITHEEGDIITVTHPIGLSSMTMRIASVEMPAPGKWRLRLVQYAAGAYSSSTPSAPSYLSPGLTSQGGLPENVTGLAASGGPGAGRITWVPNSSTNYRETELRLGVSWAAGTFLARVTGSVYPWNIVTEGTYTVWAKHYDVFANESAVAASVNVTVDAAGVAGATSDISLVPTGAMSINGNSARKTTSSGAWDASAHSRESFIGGCFAACSPSTNVVQVIFGINTDPATNASYTSIDYSMQMAGDGNLYAFQGSTALNSGTSLGTYAAGDTLMMTYYGGVVRWHKNGTILFQLTDASMVSSRLFFDSSFFDASRIERIRFGPLSPDFWNTLGGKPTDPELLNSYQIIGQNRLSESDQAVMPRFVLSDIGNGAVFDAAAVRFPEAWGWTTANFVLQGGRTRNVAVRQIGRHSGTTADNDNDGNFASADLVFDSWFAVIPGERVCASCYVVSQRCTVLLYFAVYDAAGTPLAFPPYGQATAQTNLGRTTASTAQSNVLGNYQRPYAIATIPANAARARVILRKFNTQAGQSDSWVFAGAPQFEAIAANASGPSPYSPGPVAAIGTEQLVAKTSYELLRNNGIFSLGSWPTFTGSFDITSAAWTQTYTNTTSRTVDVLILVTVSNVGVQYAGSYSTVTQANVYAEALVSGGGGAFAQFLIEKAPDPAVGPRASGAFQYLATLNPGQNVQLTLMHRSANTTSASRITGQWEASIQALKV